MFSLWLQVSPDIEFRAECRNRKNGLSINSMICAGPSFRIYAANANFPGSNHDSIVFRESEFYKQLCVDNFTPIPHGLILADKGYPVRSFFHLQSNF